MSTLNRVQVHTASHVNQEIEQDSRRRVIEAAGDHGKVTQRLSELDEEWDIERFLEMNASALAFTGVALGLLVNKRFFVIPCLVLPFLFQHAVQGWCPPIPVLRRIGVRTRSEIDKEKYALKALRGDFKPVYEDGNAVEKAVHAWDAVTA